MSHITNTQKLAYAQRYAHDRIDAQCNLVCSESSSMNGCGVRGHPSCEQAQKAYNACYYDCTNDYTTKIKNNYWANN
jgi:hypothetical protein